MLVTVTTIAGLVVGFIAGLCAYRTSRRWCRSCGDTLSCPTCSGLGIGGGIRPGRL